MILAKFDGPGAFEYCLQSLPWLYGIGRVQVIGTVGASTEIVIRGATYSQRLQLSRGSDMKNRLSQYSLSEEDAEDYEDWADALFELVFNEPNDVGTLVYGSNTGHPHMLKTLDFGLTQTPEQIKRWHDNHKNDGMN